MPRKQVKKKFSAYCKKKLEEYAKLLSLEDYRVTFEKGKSDDNCTFYVFVNFPYKSVAVFYTDDALEQFKKGHYEEINYGLMHELCHVPIHNLQRIASLRYVRSKEITHAMEEATDHFTRIITRLIKQHENRTKR